MTICVTGSRGWTDRTAIHEALARYPAGTVLIHGACPTGADALADERGRALGFDVRRMPAEWGTHGKAAGPIRNRQMLDLEPDVLLVFWDGQSRGTADCATEAERRGIRVEPADWRTTLRQK